MDKNGYPEEHELKKIREWSVQKGWYELLEYVRTLWIYPTYFNKENDTYKISTGGWSGHEETIAALEDNSLFWAACWGSSRRGGHYTFVLPE